MKDESVRVREAVIGDAEPIALVKLSCDSRISLDVLPSALPVEVIGSATQRLRGMFGTCERVYVAEAANKQIIGFASGMTREPFGDLLFDCELLMVFVSPHMQRLGVGEALVRTVIARLIHDGGHSLLVRSTPQAMAFYERLGGMFLRDEQGLGQIEKLYGWSDMTMPVKNTKPG